ncbi:MAG: ankyrin repeat domain-containing protein [Litorimonas sp.]
MTDGFQQGGGFFYNTQTDIKALKAAKEGKIDVLSFMIDEDMISDYNVTDKEGRTLLHHLSMSNPKPLMIIKRLVVKNPDIVNRKDNDGNTAIHYAYNDNELVSLLQSLGGKVNVKNKGGLFVGGARDSSRSRQLNMLIYRERNDVNKEIIKLIVKKNGVSVSDAKLIKAGLWLRIKDDPSLSTSLGRALRIKSIVEKGDIGYVDIDKVKSLIKAYHTTNAGK